MDDTAACIDLCESNGFAAPAAALRALAQGKAPFYLVRAMMGPRYVVDGFAERDIAPPVRKIFLDRPAAERYARTLTAKAIRNYRPDLTNGPPSRLTATEFVRDVESILGIPYELPDAGGQLFPESATDDQLRRIGDLLNFVLFDVVEFGPATPA